ncbi:MAG: hypothetical protein KY448_16265, partial [Cyanobacteria bacterium 0813]|nr:hypothetical protein [Cyanobacteria bacterium 0813]
MSNLLCSNGQLDLLIDRPEQIELREITAAEATLHDRENAITPVKKKECKGRPAIPTLIVI